MVVRLVVSHRKRLLRDGPRTLQAVVGQCDHTDVVDTEVVADQFRDEPSVAPSSTGPPSTITFPLWM